MANNFSSSFGSRPDFNIGTITLTDGDKNFTISGASLRSGAILPGDTIMHTNGKVLIIESIVDETNGILSYPCSTDCAGVFATRIRYQSDGSRLSPSVIMLAANLSDGLLASISQTKLNKDQIIIGDEVDGTVTAVDLTSDIVKETDAKQFISLNEKDQIDSNAKQIELQKNTDNITEGVKHLFLKASERDAIATNTDNIATNTKNITTNTDNIATNTDNITTNTKNITKILNAQNSFVGQIAFFPALTPPDGWLKANGALLSRKAYPNLWAFAVASNAIASDSAWNAGRQGFFSYGTSDDVFRVPDLRGEFLRSWDDGRGVDNGRVIGSSQSDAIRNITGGFSAAGAIAWQNAYGSCFLSGGNATIPAASTQGISGLNLSFDASRQVPTASENRPINLALLACIRY